MKKLCFTTNFRLNILKEVNMIFIDGTFKKSSRNFYQILNIVGYLEQHDLLIPIFTSLLTSKTEKIYNYTLIEFRKLIKALNIQIKFEEIKFMADFEDKLREVIKKISRFRNNGMLFSFY